MVLKRRTCGVDLGGGETSFKVPLKGRQPLVLKLLFLIRLAPGPGFPRVVAFPRTFSAATVSSALAYFVHELLIHGHHRRKSLWRQRFGRRRQDRHGIGDPRGKPRTVPLPKPLLAELEGVPVGDRHGKLFAWASRHGVCGPLKRACKMAGVEYPPSPAKSAHLRYLDADLRWAGLDRAEGSWRLGKPILGGKICPRRPERGGKSVQQAASCASTCANRHSLKKRRLDSSANS
jgi:hypothetical protein